VTSEIFLPSEKESERAKIDKKIIDIFGIEFFERNRSCTLGWLFKKEAELKSKAPNYEYRFLNEMRRRGINLQHQVPLLYRYFADFVHFANGDNVVIEIDGPSHEGRTKEDRERRQILEVFRFEVMRFDVARNSDQFSKMCDQVERRLSKYRTKNLKALLRPSSGTYPSHVESPLFQRQLEFAKRKKEL
jgi:very-short-patch-repair endonuclease